MLSDRIDNFDKGIRDLQRLETILDTASEYQLAEPQGLMSAGSYKTKVAEPLV